MLSGWPFRRHAAPLVGRQVLEFTGRRAPGLRRAAASRPLHSYQGELHDAHRVVGRLAGQPRPLQVEEDERLDPGRRGAGRHPVRGRPTGPSGTERSRAQRGRTNTQ